MKGRIVFFVILCIFIVLLFALLYAIGIINIVDPGIEFLSTYRVFYLQNPLIILIYMVILSIFFILVLAIVIRIILSMKNEAIQLASSSIDEFSIDQNMPVDIEKSYSQLAEKVGKNFQALKQYSDTLDSELSIVQKMEIDAALEDRLDELYQKFSQMISDIIQSGSVSELFEKLLFWGADISHSQRASIMVVDKEKRDLYIYKTLGWNSKEREIVHDIRIPLGTGISGKVAAESKRIFVTNVETYQGIDFKHSDHYSTKSFISLPIIGVKKVIAVLNLTERKNGIYTMNDLEMLNILTNLSSKIFELNQLKRKV